MNKNLLKPAAILLAIMLILFVLWHFLFKVFEANLDCNIKIIDTVSSSFNDDKIFLYEKDCGNTSGLSLNISIAKDETNKELKSGIIFSSDLPIEKNYDEIFEMKWLSETIINIKYNQKFRIFKKEEQLNNYKIIYEKFEK